MKLGYWGFEVDSFEEWPEFAAVHGFDVDQDGETMFFRYDRKEKRIILTKGEAKPILAFAGLELDSESELNGKINKLKSVDCEVTALSKDECNVRSVEKGVFFHDPNDIRFELVIGQKNSDEPLQNKTIEHGFETGENGELGAGHIALVAKDIDKTLEFWTKVMGASISDYITHKTEKGDLKLTFTRFNERHHTLAWAALPFDIPTNIHHFEVQVKKIVDVGKTFERASNAGMTPPINIGQHTNDKAVSFYSLTPAQVMMEFGANCIRVKGDDWEIKEYDNISSWGHVDKTGLT